MGQIPDAANETLISQLLAERAQLQARITDLTVELECAQQYHPALTPANFGRLTAGVPWAPGREEAPAVAGAS